MGGHFVQFDKTSHGFLRLSGDAGRAQSGVDHNPKEEFMMKSLNRSGVALIAIALLGLTGTSLFVQGQSQNQATGPARDKYDFKVQKDERTFAENLLHVAAVDYDLIRRVSQSNIGPDSVKNTHNPSRDVYKTKADVVSLIEQAVADGAAVIKQQGDAGLDKTTPFAWETGKHVVHNSYIWITAIEHSTEHFGQLVVYYRANNLVPPESRR